MNDAREGFALIHKISPHILAQYLFGATDWIDEFGFETPRDQIVNKQLRQTHPNLCMLCVSRWFAAIALHFPQSA